MQALLESFIQEINKIDDVGELRRRLIAMKKDEIESRNGNGPALPAVPGRGKRTPP